ncbi:hypothetical protein [Sulfuricurvum sp.]|uniref:hypothetical protein n=1 Tax=Sulfuricurvum sp. TaxID=2025608 RepID=UPI002D38FDC7|nr:hypothetical protein [Sulfuricurvum sp.]HZF70768.1 hypothetical protein [Sulfuricurvum sp.]
MVNGIKDSIKAKLYDFAYTPFISSYIISWILFNHKYLLVYFGTSTLDDKLFYLGECHVEFLFPLYIALIYVFIYPAIGLVFYYVTLWYNKKSMKIKQQIEDETPITQEQARELKREHYKLADERDQALEKLKESQKEHTQALANTLKPLQDQIESYYSTQKVSDELIQKLEAENESLKKSLENLPLITAERDELKEKFDNIIRLDTSDYSDDEVVFAQSPTVEAPKEIIQQEDDRTKILRYFYEGNYTIASESNLLTQIVNVTKIPRPKVKLIYDQLLLERILNKNTSGYVSITDSGNKMLVELFDNSVKG